MKAGNVPTARIGPVIAELIADRWPHGDGVEVLAKKVGCSYDAIDGIRCQQLEGCDFDLADKLLCALGRVDIWRGQLADVYLGIDLGCRQCERDGCQKRVEEHPAGGGRPRRYCSDQCRWLAASIRNGNATGQLLRQKGKCLKGHALTAENTTNGQCKTCKRKSQRAWAKAKRQRQRDLVRGLR